ncbi:MAG: hypothetical protein HQK49_10410 [Oligoflexia bacterium]|nr:hypothetical protein [Oligoflexia bacterium]
MRKAQKGNGVYWSSPTGELLGVEFDDVNFDEDRQTLVLKGNIHISIEVKNGKIIKSTTEEKKK